ncbi:hypothetical protein [Micavibrio aeruginosavorus]|uniref:hypothetical protein n=1 Tax=Micavibrio aeruginosavorus TaxID=349221 RepID=UPI003F4A9E70
MTLHTPGPWIIDSRTSPKARVSDVIPITDIVGKWFCITVFATEQISPEEHRANCRLVAAAPDLLGALEVAVTSMLDSGYKKNSASVLKARAAIALAREGF